MINILKSFSEFPWQPFSLPGGAAAVSNYASESVESGYVNNYEKTNDTVNHDNFIEAENSAIKELREVNKRLSSASGLSLITGFIETHINAMKEAIRKIANWQTQNNNSAN